jgi:hypothetical protein
MLCSLIRRKNFSPYLEQLKANFYFEKESVTEFF